MNLYISDTHFGHANCINFDNRPFRDAEEMDAELIRRWNEKVTDRDDVYFVGDLAYRSAHAAIWYLAQLRGRKHLVIGNHDRQMLSDPESMRYWVSVDKLLTIEDQINGRKTKVTLCHYPLVAFPGAGLGGYHVYGHLHASPTAWAAPYLWAQHDAFDACCTITNYAPTTLRELMECNEQHRMNHPQPAYPQEKSRSVYSEKMDLLCPRCGKFLTRTTVGNRAFTACDACGFLKGAEITF